MSDYLSTTARLSSIKRHRKNRHPQSQTTTDRPHSPISILNDDVLLNIFYLFRLHAVPVRERPDPENCLVHNNWLGLRWWYKLARVSRRWRRIILASPSLLDLHLLCTNLKMNRVPVAEMLAHSPPLPLAIVYIDRYDITAANDDAILKDEEHALFAISHRDRVDRIVLWMSSTTLQRLIPAMHGEFPILEHLSINCFQKDERISFTLPRTFRAPSLRRILLRHVALPLAIRSPGPILTSNGGLRLVSLWLINIPASAYIPPNQMLTLLSLMPQLERLVVESPFALPNRDVVGTTTITTDVPLPNLRAFSFKGGSTYLEYLLSRITTPVLTMFQVEFFNQLTFTVPCLERFIQSSANLIIPADLWLCFDRDHFKVSTETEWYQELRTRPLDLRINCRHLDWQVAFAVRLFRPLSPILSVVKKLKLTFREHSWSSEWHDDIDRTQWRRLFEPFSNVKVLHVEGGEHVNGLFCSLRSEDGEPSMELLPNLEELTYSSGTPDVREALTLFVNERLAAGHPVHLHPQVRDGKPVSLL